MPRRSLEQPSQAFSALASEESKKKSRASRSGEASLPPREARTAESSGLESPLFEDETSVSYLGVRLEKAPTSDSPFVPDKSKFGDYVSDEYALKLQQKMALAMSLGEPVLIEGGTSLGKTTTALKMASDLGYETYYINLNGNADVESLMGKYVPNAQRERDPRTGQAIDSEYRFADGQVTSALRQESGRIKMIILDEINATSPEVLKRLNEILNAIERSTEIILTEDASERISVSKETTKVIGLMNPSGQGYLGVNPLSKELIARWVYQKEPEQLPHESFTYRRKARRGQLPLIQPDITFFNYLQTPEISMPTGLEALGDIPGYDTIEDLFDEFHHSAKVLLKERRLAGSQTQEFIFEDNRQLRRFQEFILKFYSPEQDNLNQVVAKALEYLYLNMLESEEDKKILQELANKVRYEAPKSTKRKGLKGEVAAEEEEIAEESSIEAVETSGEFLTYAQLQKWLKETKTPDGKSLESKLEGGSLEALIKRQEAFYQERYGKDFKLDRDSIKIEASRLTAIAKGLETGAVNYPLIVATPEKLTKDEQNQTEAEFVYHKLLEPLKEQGLKIWAETGAERWSGLTLKECLKDYIPVTVSDFKDSKGKIKLNNDNWIAEFQRIIKAKGQAPKTKPQTVKLVFTDARQDVPEEVQPVNLKGEATDRKASFIEMIQAQVQVLNSQEWITLASQLYAKDKTYASRNTYDWTMSILDHQGKGKKDDPPVSAGRAGSGSGGVYLRSNLVGAGYSGNRWRCSL